MKRSGFKPRTKPLRASQPARASSTVRRPRQCRVKLGGCGESFYPSREKQIACSEECAANMAPYLNAKKEEARRKEESRKDRESRERMKGLRKLRTEAQTEFNRFIRHRDRLAGWGCICCGAPLNWDSPKQGGEVDAGHYIGRGAAIELAFDERNVNAQRKSCNRPGGASRQEFRAGMVARWGLAVVEELEGPHALPQLRHDDLRDIRETYRRKANELEKLIERA